MGKSNRYKIEEFIGKPMWSVAVIGLSSGNQSKWDYKCICGSVFSDYPSRVVSGHRKSCGCIKGKHCLTHGCNGDEFYPTWWGMMRRCHHKESHNYKRYGGRGITVCDDWNDPAKFIEWARETIGRKTRYISLDRIDNDKGYCPENCRWSTAKEQSNNRRSNVFYEIDGDTKTFAQWCEFYRISDNVVWERINKLKWDAKKAFTEPVGIHGSAGRIIEIDGVTKSIGAWCKFYGVSYSTAYKRISRGVDFKTAVSVKGTRGKPLK